MQNGHWLLWASPHHSQCRVSYWRAQDHCRFILVKSVNAPFASWCFWECLGSQIKREGWISWLGAFPWNSCGSSLAQRKQIINGSCRGLKDRVFIQHHLTVLFINTFSVFQYNFSHLSPHLMIFFFYNCFVSHFCRQPGSCCCNPFINCGWLRI